MKIKKIFVFTAGLLVITAVACKAQQHKRNKQKKASLLWKITGNGLSAPSYLFGTIHLICPDKFLWTPTMQQAFDSSSQIAFELNMSNPDLKMKVAEGMLLPEGKSLSDFFNAKDYRHLVKYAIDSLDIPEFSLQRMKPFAVLTMLSIEDNITCKGTPIGYETKLMNWGKNEGKEILGLEKAEEQLAILDKMNKDSTIKYIIKLLNHPNQSQKQYRQLLSAYLHQRLDTIQKLIQNTSYLSTDLNTLLYNRNKKWIPEIEKYIQQKSTFIAVGAGHLSGPGGLIQLLRKEGYTVVPLR